MKNYCLLLLLLSPSSFSQNNAEKAKAFYNQGIELKDAKKNDEAFSLFEKAAALKPENCEFTYQMALLKYEDGKFAEVIRILENFPLKQRPESFYILLGSSYGSLENWEKAIATYNDGLLYYPKVGELYSKSGVSAYNQKKYDDAIEYWERGAKADPQFALNYYYLALIYDSTEERVWTLLYSEIFMNLESNTSRTTEISKLLYKNYQACYIVESDSSGEYKLASSNIVIGSKKALKHFKEGMLPFEQTFALTFVTTSNFMQGINMKTICAARKNFLDWWFDNKKFDKDYPNKLLSYQKQMEKDGVLEAYSYAMLSDGNIAEYKKWFDTNHFKMANFMAWRKTHPLELKTKDSYAKPDYQ